MNIKPFKNLGIVVIDNTYSDRELDLIWSDIEKINQHNLLKSPSETGGAKDYITGEYLKNNHGVYLDKLFREKIIDYIPELSKKFFTTDVSEAVESLGPTYKSWNQINIRSNLLSYYEDSDFYSPHIDQAVFTILTWVYKQPKNWEGGILKLPEYNTEIEPKFNRSIIFPSCFLHEVSPVKMKSNLPGSGRYVISHFSYINPIMNLKK
jgi:Rps23 Pro-64 3,4-dihydroxylase Tpa1-like proline 4-hydroxylase